MRNLTRNLGIYCIAVVSLALGGVACGSNPPPSPPLQGTETSVPSATTVPATVEPSGAEFSSPEPGNIAWDCLRPLVGQPDSSGQTAISAELNGDWPSDPVIHASVTFTSSTQLQDFSDQGETVYVSDGSGDAVSTVKVWVTGADGFEVECRTWALQP